MVAKEPLNERIAEFEDHLWDHTTDPFQLDFDERLPLAEHEVEVLTEIIRMICGSDSDDAIADILRARTRHDPELIHTVLQVVGLTRNKVLTDLRARTQQMEVTVPGDVKRLPVDDYVWSLASRYLMPRLRAVFEPLCVTDQHGPSLESLNQATWPGWVRQRRAKLQGHEAEHRMALLLSRIGLPFEPVAKIETPASPDVQIHGVSFDLVVPAVTDPRVCVKATVHTANIGQFGESKDKLEIDEAIEMITDHFPGKRPVLLAMIDGIGFRSNRAGLNGVLLGADEFCQFASIWKAAVVAASELAKTITVALPDPEKHSAFLDRHGDHAKAADWADERPTHAIPAGEAFVWLA